MPDYDSEWDTVDKLAPAGTSRRKSQVDVLREELERRGPIPDLVAACEFALCWMTNVNVAEPLDVARKMMDAMAKAGYDQAKLDDIAIAIMRGAAAVGGAE